jgi:hypothetical protein
LHEIFAKAALPIDAKESGAALASNGLRKGGEQLSADQTTQSGNNARIVRSASRT